MIESAFAILNVGPSLIFWGFMIVAGLMMATKVIYIACVFIWFMLHEDAATARDEISRRFL